ncbi:hypothetical protein L0244_39740 [bacterium]|nr:hypothetical protein [bacterium]
MKFQTNIMMRCDCPDCGMEVPLVIEQSSSRPWTDKRFIDLSYAHHDHPNGRGACKVIPVRGICSVCQMAVQISGECVIEHFTGISNELCPGSDRPIYDFSAELALMEMMK